MPPTLQALAAAVLDGSPNNVVYARAMAWVDAGCPTLAPETAALIDRHRQAWTALRDAVLHGGIDGLDNDEINAVLGLIDEHTPEDV